MQCYVIVTARSLLWTLLTLVSTMAVLSAILTPKWLIGPSLTYTPRQRTAVFPTTNNPMAFDEIRPTAKVLRTFARSLGLFTRCTLIEAREQCAAFTGMDAAEGGAGFPGAWQASLVFLSFGLAIGILTTCAALLGCCVQAVCANKSLFNIAGVAQAAAGVLYIVGMMLFPFGFESDRVQRVCGEDASAFYMADCHFGWSFWAAVAGVLGTFICAVLSHQAETATSSDRVQEEIDEGKSIICLP